MGLADEIKKLEKLYKQDSAISDEKNNKREQILKQILAGKSTGDPITDMLFILDRPFDPKMRKLVKGIETRIEQWIGEPLLIETQSLNDRGSRITVALSLGIIDGPVIYDAKNTQLLVHTHGIHATKEKLYCGLDWSLEESRIGLIKLRKKAKLPEMENTEKNNSVQQTDWVFNTSMNHQTYNVMSIPFVNFLFYNKRAAEVEDPYPMLSHKPKNEYGLFLHFGEKAIEEYFSIPTLDISYVTACERLNMAPAKKFHDAYDLKVQETKKTVLGIIENKLGLPKREQDNGALKAILRSAIRLNMHEDDTKINPSPGVTVHMGEYITGLCNLYKIEIPKE
jgi:hypothetical protein